MLLESKQCVRNFKKGVAVANMTDRKLINLINCKSARLYAQQEKRDKKIALDKEILTNFICTRASKTCQGTTCYIKLARLLSVDFLCLSVLCVRVTYWLLSYSSLQEKAGGIKACLKIM